MSNFDLTKYLAEGKLFKEAYNIIDFSEDPDSDLDGYVKNHWDIILKDILRAHTDLRNSKGGENIPERPSQLDIDIVLGRFDGADEFTDVDPSVYEDYFDFYDMYLVTQRDEENTKDISVEDYPEGDYSGYTKRDDLPNLAEGKLLKEDSEDIAEMAYERDSVEDIVKRIKPILANHPQLKKQEDPEQYLIDFVTKRKRFINKNEAPIGKDKFARNIGTMPYDKYIKLQFNEYIYSTTP
mgnify:FL=1